MESNELFEIIVGTYEEYLLGYKLVKVDKEYKLKHTIANHSHKASIRSITWHDRYLASGSADECIHIYDLILRKECGLLMNNSGTVTSLQFTPDGHYLIAASEDGSVSMFGTGSWVLDKIWSKAHKGKAVNHIAIHPSGKMALTVGNDCTLRTWNLVKGRCAYTVNIASKCRRPEIIEWSLCGQYFGLINECNVEIYSIATANVTRTIQEKCKITCIKFLEENKICIGQSTGNILCFDFLTGDQIWQLSAKEESRIKCLGSYENWLISATSSGALTVYDLSARIPYSIAVLDTSCRITCMTLSQIPSDEKTQIPKRKKRSKSKMTVDEKTTKMDDKIDLNEEVKKVKRKTEGNKNNIHCYPPDQKWKIEIL